jgi:hypothetical protein
VPLPAADEEAAVREAFSGVFCGVFCGVFVFGSAFVFFALLPGAARFEVLGAADLPSSFFSLISLAFRFGVFFAAAATAESMSIALASLPLPSSSAPIFALRRFTAAGLFEVADLLAFFFADPETLEALF